MLIILSIITFLSTMLGGLFGIYHKDKLHLILGFTAGVLMAVVAFDIFPEIIRLTNSLNVDPVVPMGCLIIGFMVFHVFEKVVLIHHSQEESYGSHHHPVVGIFSALALAFHSFLDGVGIGLAFQVSTAVGILVTVAVIAHDFSDGLNTVSLVLVNKNSRKRALQFLVLDALAPVLGALSTKLYSLPENMLLVYLGFFAGFLLYIGASDILPEAHSEKSSYKTILLTLLGIGLIFVVTRFT